MTELKQPSDFPDLSREDTVSLTLTAPGSSDEVEFVLQTDSGVTAWKALEIWSSNGSKTHNVDTQNGQHGPLSFSVPADDLIGSRLILAKAKNLGFHTGMYELQNLSSFRGRSFQFLWRRDDDRDGPVAGFFRDLGNGISTAANAVADVLETVVVIIAEVVSTFVETIGNVIADLLDSVGNVLGAFPVIGGVLRGAFHWLATVTIAAFDLGATIIKGGLDLAANVISGITRIVGGGLGGLLAWDGRIFVKGVGDFASGIAGSFVAIGGKTLELVHAVLLQVGERPLTVPERDMLTRVYRNSVNLNVVRVIVGNAGIFSINNSAFALGNKIYMKGRDPATHLDTLVHECCHVWQYQHKGTRYLSDALWAQATLPGAVYSWIDELARGHLRWQDFNLEAQASFLDRIFNSGIQLRLTHTIGEFYDDDPVGPNVEFNVNNTDYTVLARESVAYVRGARWTMSRP